jgi:hypothetical protein
VRDTESHNRKSLNLLQRGKSFCADTIVFDSIPSKKFAQSLPDGGFEGSMTAHRQRCQTPAKE